jgi:LDH2 family malate/lactate/ureidoglycolate dehydrogenase
MDSKVRWIPKSDLETFVHRVCEGAGIDSEAAALVARHLVLANLRGIESHGVSRLPIYLKRLEAGLENKQTKGILERETASSALINGQNGIGIVLATKGMEKAVSMAKQTGLAVVGIKNSAHCGMLADYTQYAARHQCIAIAMTNAPSAMAPWGGRQKYFGTNPISYAIPAGREEDLVFDMASSVVARGKLVLALYNNEPIPIGWAITKDGKPTTDPEEALDGGLLLPVGGPKGYGIALLVDVLSGMMTGASFGPYIGNLYEDLDRSQNVGQFFFVMRADLFEPIDVFQTKVDQMIGEIRGLPLAQGFDRIYLPGEIERDLAAEREARGIPLGEAMLKELEEAGSRYGVTSPF